jgi:hypothetical protein
VAGGKGRATVVVMEDAAAAVEADIESVILRDIESV